MFSTIREGKEIKTEGSETRTGGYGKIRNFRNGEIVTGIKKIESMGGLVNKSCQNLKTINIFYLAVSLCQEFRNCLAG